MSWVYMNTLQGFYTDSVDYFNALSTLFPFLSLKFSQDLTEGNLLSMIIEKCVRFTDSDPSNSSEVRIAALSLLSEVWLTYSSYIDKNDQYLNSI